MDQNKYSLRERKYAKSKISLARAFIERLKTHRFEEISITELCASTDVSEGTFFNYFPQKLDLIHYIGALSGIHVIWKTHQKADKDCYLSLIDTVFDYMSENFKNHNLVANIASTIIRQKQLHHVIKITRAEKYFAFPGCAGIEDINPPSILFEDYFEEILKKAVKNMELPETTDVYDAVLFLKTIMAGIPLAIKREKIKDLKFWNRKMLKLLWKALGRKYDRGNQ
jgi:AcrR family transcriptional regulator